MINIEITRKPDDPEITIKVRGHANYAPHGKDIVCAGVSTIMNTAILGLEAIADDFPSYVHINIQEGE